MICPPVRVSTRLPDSREPVALLYRGWLFGTDISTLLRGPVRPLRYLNFNHLLHLIWVYKASIIWWTYQIERTTPADMCSASVPHAVLGRS